MAPRDGRTVKEDALASFPVKSRQGRQSKASSGSGIAQACGDTSLPTDLWSAARCQCDFSREKLTDNKHQDEDAPGKISQ